MKNAIILQKTLTIENNYCEQTIGVNKKIDQFYFRRRASIG